jgi:hypothetical protein
MTRFVNDFETQEKNAGSWENENPKNLKALFCI